MPGKSPYSSIEGFRTTIFRSLSSTFNIGANGQPNNLTVFGNISATGNLATGSNYVTTLALTANQTVTQAVDTVINFDPKNDPNSWFSRTAGVGLTARRITPTIPGYYFINYQLHWNQGTSGAGVQNNIQILKSNAGAAAITINLSQQPVNSSDVRTCQTGSVISYFNGSTDYVFFQAYTSNATSQVVTGETGGTWTKVEMFKIN